MSPVFWQLDHIDARAFEGRICLGDGWELDAWTGQPIKIAGLERIVGDLPLAVLLMDSSVLGGSAADRLPEPWSRIAREVGESFAPSSVMLSLFGGEYSGRFEGLKVAVTEMPGIPTFGYIGFISWDEHYWTNWPGSENPYTQPYTHWGPFKYMTPFLEPTGN